MHFQPYSARYSEYGAERTKTNQACILIAAAEKAGAKVVVYGPLSSEIVAQVVNIFTKKTAAR